MKNIIGMGIFTKFHFVFSWGFSFFSTGYLLYRKLYILISNEFNKLKSITYSNLLYV